MIYCHKRQFTYCNRKGDLIMKRKQLWKVLGTGGLALSLLVSPMTGVSALAAEDGTTETGGDGGAAADAAKTGGSKKGLNPLQKGSPAVGDQENDPDNYQPAVPANDNVEIPVWGFTQDTTVYSVDVEWGAMTFQYENSTWDPETHTKTTGAGWQVYDSEADKVVVNDDGTKVEEHAINEIKVTNHSNDKVWATLSYAKEAAYTGTDGKFSFTTGTETGDTDALTDAASDGSVPAYLTLETADNGADGAAGTPTVGKAYFMPDGIQASQEIDKWTKIGTITVGIKTEQPTAAQPPVGP